MPTNRGEIYNHERARQQKDYSGLRIGNITPTDIDGLIEYKNKAYIILELKYLDALTTMGQRLALERLTDDLQRAGKESLCIIANHETHDADSDIDAAAAYVLESRYKGKWRVAIDGETVIDMVKRFLGWLA